MGKIFGTDGIRLKVKNELQAEFLVKISQAICEEFGERSVFLLGRDVRYGGELIRHAIISGFLTSGCRVYDAGLITTPALQYVIKNEGFFDGGVMITASHNPPEYNGIKVIDSDGIEIPREKENEIEKIYLENRISGKISSEEKFFIPK
ncbi:MAG: phosphoglucosamine mutase, partial [Fervidicoccus fontis]